MQKKFRVARFDKDVCELIFKGVTHASEIRDKMMVDPNAFEQRLSILVERGIVARDSLNPDVVRLGVEGYNLFAPKVRKPRQKKAEAKIAEKAEEKAGELTPPSFTVIPFAHPIEAEKKEEMDLGELLKNGAPFKKDEKHTSSKIEVAEEKLPAPKSQQDVADLLAAEDGKALVLEGKAACELCKAKFALNMKNTDLAKFGHCFCGAAYHKDCYESLSSTGGYCIRCGRKLKLHFDKRTEDAVKGIKDVFE